MAITLNRQATAERKVNMNNHREPEPNAIEGMCSVGLIYLAIGIVGFFVWLISKVL